jgi:hypothetical protein
VANGTFEGSGGGSLSGWGRSGGSLALVPGVAGVMPPDSGNGRTDSRPSLSGVGMGLDAGEAVPTEGGYRGGALHMAARLCSIAHPGQILASEAIVHLARHVPGVKFRPRRRVRLKGLDGPVNVIEILSEEPLPPAPEPPRPRRLRGMAAMAIALVLCVAVVAGAAAWHFYGSGQPTAIPGNSVVEVETASNDVSAPVGVGTTPAAVAAGDGSVWVLNADDRTLSRLDPKTDEAAPPRALPGVGTPVAIAVGEGSLWVVTASSVRRRRCDWRSPPPRC